MLNVLIFGNMEGLSGPMHDVFRGTDAEQIELTAAIGGGRLQLW
jgi:hypothetical protein